MEENIEYGKILKKIVCIRKCMDMNILFTLVSSGG